MRFLATSNPEKTSKLNVNSYPMVAAKEILKEPRSVKSYFSTHSVWSYVRYNLEFRYGSGS